MIAIPHIIPINKVLKSKVNQFFIDHFSQRKAKFLIDHGEWHSRGNENRFAMLLDDKIIGYFGIIPASINKYNVKSEALWWIDLVINKKYRGLGYQSMIDEYVRNRPEIKLGIPNQSAAKIHTKHKWSVKKDPRVFLFPINPKISLLSKKEYSKYGILLRIFISVISPVVKFILHFIKKYQVKWTVEIVDPSPNLLQDIFYLNKDSRHITTWRDTDYLNHRYLKSPKKNELRYFVCKKNNTISHYCIIRTISKNGNKIIRILDLYGNFHDIECIADLLKAVIKEAYNINAIQITALNCSKKLNKVYRRCGFIISRRSMFCYYENDLSHLNHRNNEIYFTLGDSDNDDNG